jgi:hypothetical protein
MSRTFRSAALALAATALAAPLLGGCSGSADNAMASTASTRTSAASQTAVAGGGQAPAEAGPVRRVTCDEAFLVKRAPPRQPTGPDTVGAVRFDGIADGRRPENLVKPTRARPYWAFKTPFDVTLGPRQPVLITASGGRILIGRATTGGGAKPLAKLPRRVVVIPCPGRSGGGRHVASFPGGFAFPEPECVRVSVRTGEQQTRSRVFPFGVAAC